MLVFIIACIVSFVPCVALLLWLRKIRAGEEGEAGYKKLCGKALLWGFLAAFWVVLFSGCTYILLRLTGVQRLHALLYEALSNFIVLAFVEELAKFLMFRNLMKRTDHPVSWLEATALMTIVGTGFGLLESILYAVVSGLPVVMVRGISIPHTGYGFIVGYFSHCPWPLLIPE